MEVVKETQRGAVVDPVSGQASVPTPNGGTRQENRSEKFVLGQWLLEDKPETHAFIKELIEKNGMEAAYYKARGQSYTPSLGQRVRSVATSNLTPVKAIGLVVVGAIAYKLGELVMKKLAKKFGWNILGNVVETQAEEPVEVKKFSAPRRSPTAPTQISASA